MVGWHHRLNGRGFGWTPGVGDGQGGRACCGSWGRAESDTTEWTELTCVSGFMGLPRHRADGSPEPRVQHVDSAAL